LQRQLQTARRLGTEHRSDITWIHGNAEQVPRPDDLFDFAMSEYGAAIWCNPFLWVPEAHRLLCAGGVLAFLGNHPLALARSPIDGSPTSDTLVRDWFFTASTGGRRSALRAASSSPCPQAAGSACLTAGFRRLDYQELQARMLVQANRSAPGWLGSLLPFRARLESPQTRLKYG